MDQFFALGGKHYLVFLYQEPEPEARPLGNIDHFDVLLANESFSVDALHPPYSAYSTRSRASSMKPMKPKVTIANLDEQTVRGICLCFIRNSNQSIITEQNIEHVCKSSTFVFSI